MAYCALGIRSLMQISDKLGLRQVYYWDGASFFLYSRAQYVFWRPVPKFPGSVNFARLSAFRPTVVE